MATSVNHSGKCVRKSHKVNKRPNPTGLGAMGGKDSSEVLYESTRGLWSLVLAIYLTPSRVTGKRVLMRDCLDQVGLWGSSLLTDVGEPTVGGTIPWIRVLDYVRVEMVQLSTKCAFISFCSWLWT